MEIMHSSSWRRIEVVITGRTRNAFALRGTRVRIPPSPFEKWSRESECSWLSVYFIFFFFLSLADKRKKKTHQNILMWHVDKPLYKTYDVYIKNNWCEEWRRWLIFQKTQKSLRLFVIQKGLLFKITWRVTKNVRVFWLKTWTSDSQLYLITWKYFAIPALFMQDKRENGHITA